MGWRHRASRAGSLTSTHFDVRRFIILELVVENSTLGANIQVAGTSLPTFGSRRVETTLRLRDGEQHLLAGLIREEDRSTLRGFPGIMGIPVLRSLFGETDTAVRATEIVMLLTPRVVRTKELTQQDLSPIHIGTQTNFGLTGAPPLIAAQPDAGVPDTPAPDTGVPDVAPVVPDADLPDVDPVLPELAPPVEPVSAPPTPGPAAPVEPEPALPPPSDQPQTLPGLPEPSAAGQVLVTPPGAVFRVGGGPYTVPVSIAGVSQLSTISLTLFFDPNVLRVRTVQAGGTFMSQGGLEVSFSQEVDTPQDGSTSPPRGTTTPPAPPEPGCSRRCCSTRSGSVRLHSQQAARR